MNMQMESFYAAARDADYIIYNSTIDGELDNLSQLLEKAASWLILSCEGGKCVVYGEKPVSGNHGPGGYDFGYPPYTDRGGAEGLRYMHRLR